MTDKLFPDSETLSTKRPTEITEKQHEELLHKIASDIISDGHSQSPASVIIDDLRNITLKDEGYEIAKELEGSHASYNINSSFIELLEDLSYQRDKVNEGNVKAWVKAHNILPKLKVGDEITVDSYMCWGWKVGKVAYINVVYPETGIYLVDADPKLTGGTVLEFERVEEHCSVNKK